jgi:hypothetical protein
MRLRFLEVSNGFNWGKFVVGRFETDELRYESVIDATMGYKIRLIGGRGWGPDHFLFLDLQTGEGGIFRHGGSARADLNKTRLRVCPMAEPALVWLYGQDLSDLDALPALVEFTEAEAPSSMQSYRRAGDQSFCVEFV